MEDLCVKSNVRPVALGYTSCRVPADSLEGGVGVECRYVHVVGQWSQLWKGDVCRLGASQSHQRLIP